ncbi:MAG TPA: hypothetical protein VFI48_06075 [Hyphomicrobiaceae bacterium]|nr:hypothetical protein [Hyphomicrobiaceae bacterium]
MRVATVSAERINRTRFEATMSKLYCTHCFSKDHSISSCPNLPKFDRDPPPPAAEPSVPVTDPNHPLFEPRLELVAKFLANPRLWPDGIDPRDQSCEQWYTPNKETWERLVYPKGRRRIAGALQPTVTKTPVTKSVTNPPTLSQNPVTKSKGRPRVTNPSAAAERKRLSRLRKAKQLIAPEHIRREGGPKKRTRKST